MIKGITSQELLTNSGGEATQRTMRYLKVTDVIIALIKLMELTYQNTKTQQPLIEPEDEAMEKEQVKAKQSDVDIYY